MREHLQVQYALNVQSMSVAHRAQATKQLTVRLYTTSELQQMSIDTLHHLADMHDVPVLPNAKQYDIVLELSRLTTTKQTPQLVFPQRIIGSNDAIVDRIDDSELNEYTELDDEFNSSDSDSDVMSIESNDTKMIDTGVDTTTSSDTTIPADSSLIDPLHPRVKGTLIISPTSIVYQWQNEVKKHAPHLSVYIYNGRRIGSNDIDAVHIPTLAEFCQYDIVLTTYTVLSEEVNYSRCTPYSFRQNKRYVVPLSPLIECHWHRVVLDESQRIQNSVSSSARMASRLSRTYTWCVTGTPIGRHGLADLYGLILFLDIQPYNDKSVWIRALNSTVDPVQTRTRLQQLLKQCCWRHSKQHVIGEIALPPLYSETITLPFSVIENEYYKRIESSIISSTYFAEGAHKLTDDYAARQFEVLRQAATHPQISSSGTALLGKQLLPMNEIGHTLIRKAEDDKNSSERDLCRCLNELALYYIQHNDRIRAEKLLREVWMISEAGIDIAMEHDELDKHQNIPTNDEPHSKQSNKHMKRLINKSMDDKVTIDEYDINFDIVTVNSQARQWRLIELVTLYNLIELLQFKHNTLNDNERIANDEYITKLTDQYNACMNELLELYQVKIADVHELIVKYESVLIPEWAQHSSNDVQQLINQRNEIGVEQFHSDINRMSHVDSMIKVIDSQTELYLAVTHVFEMQKAVQLLSSILQQHRNKLHTQHMQHCMNELLNRFQSPIVTSSYHSNTRHRLSYTELIQKHIRSNDKEISKAMRTIDKHKLDIDFSDIDQLAIYDKKWLIARDSAQCLRCIGEVKKQMAAEQRWAEIMNNVKQSYIDECKQTKHTVNISIESNHIISNDQTTIHNTEEQLKRDVDKLRKQSVDKQHHVTYLRTKFRLYIDDGTNNIDVLSDSIGAMNECSICHSELLRPVITTCGHTFCGTCLQKWCRHKSVCPTCHRAIDTNDITEFSIQQHQAVINNNLNDTALTSHSTMDNSDWYNACTISINGENQYGTKVESIVKYIKYLLKRDPSTKCLVFTQFNKMLDWVSTALQHNSISHIHLKGSTRARAKLIDEFQNDSTSSVMLMSLRADNSGLTLCNATHVFLLEPSLNRSIELQAINRVHRIGQTRNAYVHKFIMNDSIEQKIEQTNNNLINNTTSILYHKSMSNCLSSTQREISQSAEFLHYLGLTKQ